MTTRTRTTPGCRAWALVGARRGICAAVLLGIGAAALAEPRIAPLPRNQWNAEQREIAADASDTLLGANAVATYLRKPGLARSLLPFDRYLASESVLAPRQRALLALRTAWLARSDYLWAHAAARARGAGLGDADFERVALGPHAPGWTALEAALVMAVDELEVDSFVSDGTWNTLAAELDSRALVDLVFSVGELTMIAMTANSLGFEVESGFADRRPYGLPYTVAARLMNARLIGKAPRIVPLPRETWSPELVALLDPNDTGRTVANVYPTYAHSLPMDLLRRPVGEHIRGESTLSDQQRELLLIRIGVLCRSEYEWAAHYRIGRRAGLSEADIDRIVGGPAAAADPVERALLTATDELYRDFVISDETWDALDAAFDERQLIDIVTAVGGYRMFSMAISSFGVQLDPGGQRFPEHLR